MNGQKHVTSEQEAFVASSNVMQAEMQLEG
jgi:hypothetical protein